MPDGYVDFVITSPPYDDIRNYNGYKFEFEKITKELYRIIKEGGVIIWVVADSTVNGSETGTSFKQALYFREIGFNIHDTMIYYKNNPMPQTGNRYHQHFEYMFAFSKGNPKTFNPIVEPTKYHGLANMKNRGQNGSLDYEKVERTKEKKVGNVFFYSVGGGISTKDKIAFQHPAIFPEKLVADQINTWTNEKQRDLCVNKEDYKFKLCDCDTESWEEIVSQREPDYQYRDVIYYHCDMCGEDFAVVDFDTNELLYYNYGYNK